MAVLVCTALEERLFHFLSQQLLITDNSNASSFIIYSHSHTQEGVTSLKKGSAVSLCGHGTLAVLITSKTSWTKEVIFLLHVALVRHPLECGVPSWAPQWHKNYWETEASPSEWLGWGERWRSEAVQIQRRCRADPAAGLQPPELRKKYKSKSFSKVHNKKQKAQVGTCYKEKNLPWQW